MYPNSAVTRRSMDVTVVYFWLLSEPSKNVDQQTGIGFRLNYEVFQGCFHNGHGRMAVEGSSVAVATKQLGSKVRRTPIREL